MNRTPAHAQRPRSARTKAGGAEYVRRAAAADTGGSASAARDLLSRRYYDGGPGVPDLWNHTLATMLAHKSVRRYLRRPLPDGTLELLVAAAQSAPTSSNLQAWSVVAVEDAERKRRLAKLAGDQAFIVECPLFLVWIADLHRLRRIASERDLPSEGLDYLETFMVAVIDATLAAQNAVVALESIGLGTIYIGAVRNRPEPFAAELGLPALTMPLFGLCVGYADPGEDGAVKPRLPQQAVLHRERYDWDVQRQAIERYDDHMAEFRRSQGIEPLGWIATAAQRVGRPSSLHGRDRMREVLAGFGFELR